MSSCPFKEDSVDPLRLPEVKNSIIMLEIGDLNLVEIHDQDDGPMITQHPLNNELVLSVVFDNLPKKHWKSARLVNKTWHSTLQHRWRDQMVYKVRCEYEDEDDYPDYPPVATVTTKFLDQQHPENNPNDPLQLSFYPIRNIFVEWDNCVHLEPGQNGFWEMYGHALKRLHFHRIQIAQGALFKKLLFELTPNLEEFRYYQCQCEDIDTLELNTITEYTPPNKLQKNLKVFHVNTCTANNNGTDYAPIFPISWLEFFGVFPNIQKLKANVDPQITEPPYDLVKLFHAIQRIRLANNNEVLNIREIHASKGKFAEFAGNRKNQSLLFASLPISILNVDVTGKQNSKINRLVQAFQSTLRHLTLKRDDEAVLNTQYVWQRHGRVLYVPTVIMLPQGLTKLNLLGRFFPSLEFLSGTPNLVELTMTDVSYMLQPEVCTELAALSPLIHLKKLRYGLNDWQTPALMQSLANLMPNVKTCKCIVNADGFRMLCQSWTNLEHLDLTFYFGSEDFFVEHLVQLTDLKSLKIGTHHEFKFTNKSVFEGFLKLDSLSKIELPSRVSVVRNITEEGFQVLEGKLCDDLTIWS